MNFIGGINVYVTSPSHLIICSAQSVPGLVGVVRRGDSRSSLIGAETFFITVMLLQSPRCPGWGSVVLLFPCRVPWEVVFKLWQLWSCFQVGSIVINLNNWLKNWVLDHIRSKEGGATIDSLLYFLSFHYPTISVISMYAMEMTNDV